MPLMTPKKNKSSRAYSNKYNSIRKRFRKNKTFSTNKKKNKNKSLHYSKVQNNSFNKKLNNFSLYLKKIKKLILSLIPNKKIFHGGALSDDSSKLFIEREGYLIPRYMNGEDFILLQHQDYNEEYINKFIKYVGKKYLNLDPNEINIIISHLTIDGEIFKMKGELRPNKIIEKLLYNLQEVYSIILGLAKNGGDKFILTYFKILKNTINQFKKQVGDVILHSDRIYIMYLLPFLIKAYIFEATIKNKFNGGGSFDIFNDENKASELINIKDNVIEGEIEKEEIEREEEGEEEKKITRKVGNSIRVKRYDKYFPAIITTVNVDGTYNIEWVYNDFPGFEGDANDRTNYYPGIIAAINNDETYNILFNDGTIRENVQIGDIINKKEGKLARGSTVLCLQPVVDGEDGGDDIILEYAPSLLGKLLSIRGNDVVVEEEEETKETKIPVAPVVVPPMPDVPVEPLPQNLIAEIDSNPVLQTPKFCVAVSTTKVEIKRDLKIVWDTAKKKYYFLGSPFYLDPYPPYDIEENIDKGRLLPVLKTGPIKIGEQQVQLIGPFTSILYAGQVQRLEEEKLLVETKETKYNDQQKRKDIERLGIEIDTAMGVAEGYYKKLEEIMKES